MTGLARNWSNLFGGSGRSSVPVQLGAGEIERLRVVAAALFAGMSKVGGDLIVTNQRIMFTPLNTTDVSALLRAGLKATDAPSGSSALVGWLQRQVDETAEALDDVVTVRAGDDGNWLKPPTVIFGLADGRSIEFGVLASRMSANGSAKNRTARDQLVGALST
jgi:hypothetical protein